MNRSLPFVDRRHLLQAGAAVAGLSSAPGAVPGCRWRLGNPFRADLDAFADEVIRLSPEQATSLGIDKGKYVGLKSKLSDASPQGDADWAAEVKAMRRRLAGLDRAALSPADRIRYDTVAYAADRGIEGTAFRYGGGAGAGFSGGTGPYEVSQQNGAITAVPEFLDSQHQIHTAADAEAYLARVSALARHVSTRRARGSPPTPPSALMPPDFIAANALSQLKGYRAVAAAQQRLVSSIARRTAKLGIAGDWGPRCQTLVETEVYPALDAEIAAFTAATAHASDVAGVQRFPNGEAYYAYALRLGTTLTTPAAEVHRIGLEQNEAIKGRMDALLKKQGMTQGTVAARMLALNKDPRFLYPDTDAGRDGADRLSERLHRPASGRCCPTSPTCA